MNVLFAVLLTLLSNWTMSREDSDISYEVRVPTTVAGALDAHGYFGDNLFAAERYFEQDKSIFDSTWVFSTEFDTEPGKHYLLKFDALNYYADIILNGETIASADTTFGVFVRRSFDVSGIVYAGKPNRLEVRLRRARKGDLNIGFVDWNPRPLDESMGIIGNVSLVETGSVLIEDIYVKPDLELPSLKSAELTVEVRLRNMESFPLQSELRVDFCGAVCSVPVELSAGQRRTIRLTSSQMPSLHVDNPRVWWTYDLGTPELYSISAEAQVGSSASSGAAVNFGIRSITSHLDSDNRRQFVLNGRPVLVKGAGWTDDLFLADTHESEEIQVRYVRDMGMNCIRFENIWGKDDNIYELCDKYGVMAFVGWSCQWEWEDYCGLKETDRYGCIVSPANIELVDRYFRDQVVRLRNHPSVIAWMVGSDRIPCPELEKRYLDFYTHNDYRPYVCSAKQMTSEYGGPSGTKMEGPYEYVGPEYWYLDTRHGGNFGFNTETGVGMNIPQLPSLEKMMPADSLWPLSKSYDRHCTSSGSAMNSTRKIVEVVNGQYGEPSNLREFVSRAHSADYDATRAMFESFRCNIPASTGIIQWMLNSAWPSLYWQLYDYYLLPTAAYYATKKACQPLQLIYNYKENSVYAVNESGSGFEGRARIRIYDASSKLISDELVPSDCPDNSSRKLYGVTRSGEPVFLALSLLDRQGNEIADNFYCLPAEDNRYDWSRSNWYITPIDKYADLRFVSSLPSVELSMKTKREGRTIRVSLTNDSDAISYQNILRAVTQAGDVITPAFWSDNFVTVLPGQTKELVCTLDEEQTADVALQGWNSVLKDDGSRNRSKYADNSFSKADVYRVAEPYATVDVKQVRSKRIKNIIFMIGDGMGVEQIASAWVLNGGHLNIDNCVYTGFSRTYAYDKLITDSCAGGTALAIGEKTRYGYQGCNSDGVRVDSGLSLAKKLGKKTGIVATCRLNDTTPFNYIGSSTDRSDEEGQAAQYVGSGLDFVSGGGLQFWHNRADGRDLVEEMKSLGYTYCPTLEELENCRGEKILSLLADTEMEPALDRNGYLEKASMKAIESLDNKKGFFLMIEGSTIDDWAHRHQMGYVAEEIFEFDRTVGKVLQWAEKDGHTLVVITADHSTGGLTLLDGSLTERTVKVHFSTKGHNGVLVPVFAYGPGAENFVGVHENAEIGQIVKSFVK